MNTTRPKGLLPENAVISSHDVYMWLRLVLEKPQYISKAVETLTRREANCLCHYAGIKQIHGHPKKVLARRLERIANFAATWPMICTGCGKSQVRCSCDRELVAYRPSDASAKLYEELTNA